MNPNFPVPKMLWLSGASLMIWLSQTAIAGEIQGIVRFPAGVNPQASPAVVYLASRDAGTSAPQAVVVDQRNLQFVPRVQAVALRGSIVFRNSDREAHNVNSQSGCCAFNFMIRPELEAPPVTPAEPGLVRLLCNIHQQMRGYVMVCPSSQFAVSDAEGHFRIAHVPDGVHKLVVWQEYSKPLTHQVTVAGATRVEFTLESAGDAPRTGSASARPVVPWAEVRKRISATLESAARAAQQPGGAKAADRLAIDAYFEHFEASELETAVRLYRGEERVFLIERTFAKIRRPLLVELAAGRADAALVQTAIDELGRSIDEDIRELHRNRIFDRTSLSSQQASSGSVTSLATSDIRQVTANLRKAFDEVARHAAAGNSAAAADALADAYFNVFHKIEPALAARNFARMRKIEQSFLDLRGRIQTGADASTIAGSLDSLAAEIELAAAALERSGVSRVAAATGGFWNAFVILTREGVEALLIVTALIMYLNRVGRPRDKRVIYAGLTVALAATIVTWASLQWAIARSGVAQETIEGISALAAAGVLFYVSYWLLSKSEARRWQEFLTRQVGQSIAAGGRWTIGLAAFLAVYREGAETILMFQPLLVEPARGELAGVLFGVIAAAFALAAIFWGLRSASVRMAIRPFFRVTGALLFVLAVVFAGKGVTELQEAGLMRISPVAPLMNSVITSLPAGLRDALGISATAQSLAIQGTLVAGAAISLVALWVLGRKSPQPHPPQSPAPLRPEPVTSETAV